ncbi:DUF4232 domain-containing protein [Couchioplanes caeruleus]|uniref:DUF4232 domain-containing protein n=1 Tax=Couchioplanes caeruleus TaxID=56438 RepID=UPI0020C0B18F|nr:DUF4232 domain-containing protein [Couchioplanes caeruleus]UQU62168.1 DUF4232 domain-containing protein [Couchioplanes caeruleus]
MTGSRMRNLAVPVALAALLAGCARPAPPSGSGLPVSPSEPAPSPSTTAVTCPPGGVRLEVGEGDAAMGLRVLGITLVNCGTRAYRLDGYPGVRSFAGDRTALRVRVLHGVEEIVGSALPWDGPPEPMLLEPGRRAGAGVAWRNTYDDIRHPPVTVASLEIAPRAGGPAQTVRPPGGLDLGSTGRIGVSAWRPMPDVPATSSPAGRPEPAVPDQDPVSSAGPLP